MARRPGRPKKDAADAQTETMLPGTVQDVKASYKIFGMRVLADELQRYQIGQPAHCGFPVCRGVVITSIKVFASIIEVHYANGWREDFDTAAVSVLYEPEKKDAQRA